MNDQVSVQWDETEQQWMILNGDDVAGTAVSSLGAAIFAVGLRDAFRGEQHPDVEDVQEDLDFEQQAIL